MEKLQTLGKSKNCGACVREAETRDDETKRSFVVKEEVEKISFSFFAFSTGVLLCNKA